MKHGRVNVPDWNRRTGGLQPEFVRFASGRARAPSAAREPRHQTILIVIAPGLSIITTAPGCALAEGSAAHLRGPHHQRVIPHTPLFSICQERGHGLIHLADTLVQNTSMSP